MWNRSQRAVVLAMALGIFLYLTIRLSADRARIGNPQPPQGSRAGELATLLDPNTATQAELAAIPTIGDKLAAAVIAYRETYVSTHPGHHAFNKPLDLQHVRGVGPAKMEALSEYLTFPTDNPQHGLPAHVDPEHGLPALQ